LWKNFQEGLARLEKIHMWDTTTTKHALDKEYSTVFKDENLAATCHICFGTFTVADLEVHLTRYHKKKKGPFKCYKCKKEFSIKNALTTHRNDEYCTKT
jgi:hypothetical protein